MVICYISEKMTDKRNKLKRPRIPSDDSDSSSISSTVTSSSDEDTDTKNLKPIKEYLLNRKELASQLFKSVKTEKIRMMLPQILKKVEFNDLEELCANELIGMSKARIMCVINGQEMLQSSNTEDSDNLDRSLEIISDTEWLSAEETNIKVESSNLKNKDVKKLKKVSQDQKKQNLQTKLKCKGKRKLHVKVKTEVKEKEKQKEGESLLDLLELEMRARAIRALIRKEEDSINPKNTHTNDTINTISGSGPSNNKNAKARQENLKEQLEKIDVLMKHGEDEDVFVVIQPAPTIELLSSESDTEDHTKRVNQKLVNERTSESEKIQEEQSSKSKDKNINKEKFSEKNTNVDKDKNDGQNKGENTKQRENRIENSTSLIIRTESNKNNVANKVENSKDLIKEVDLEEGEIVDNDEVVNKKIEVTSESPSKRKIKKVKRNPFIRSKKKNKENNDDNLESNKVVISDKEGSKTVNKKYINSKEKVVQTESIEIEESPKRKNDIEEISFNKLKETESNINSKIYLFDDKSLDIDEVINLDDYPDDMDDLEKSEVNKEKKDTNKMTSLVNKNTNKEILSDIPSYSETWATRYYKQDDVQNVIKESKIQSEIRKRLRERQRQSKMNNSPKVKDSEILQQSSESVIPKPTGSVEEYLALKGFSSERNNSNPEIVKSSKLLKKNDVLIGCNDPKIAKNDFSLCEGKCEKKNDSFINDNQTVEKSIVMVKKVKKLGSDVFVMNIDSTLNKNTAVEQLNADVNCDNLLVDASEANFMQKVSSSTDKAITMKDNSLWSNHHLVENFKESSNKLSEQSESNNLRKITCSLRNNETSLNSDLSNDKAFVKKESTFLSDKKLIQKLNDQKSSEQVEKMILNESKILELRPD